MKRASESQKQKLGESQLIFFGTTVSYLQGEDTVLKARDLFFEISILADLYPGLHEQLKAIEDHYGIEYGYEALKKDWSYSNDTL